MNNYEIDNIYDKNDYSFIKEYLDKTLNKLKVKNSIFSIIFVDDKKIHELNREYRNIDRITDVISFAFEDNMNIHNNDIRVLGDIYICVPQAIRQAELYEHDLKRELSFLAVHGLLHLLGFDHMTKEEEKIMFGLQKEILDER